MSVATPGRGLSDREADSRRLHDGMLEPGLMPACGCESRGSCQVASHVTKDVGMVEEAEVPAVGDHPDAIGEHSVVGMRWGYERVVSGEDRQLLRGDSGGEVWRAKRDQAAYQAACGKLRQVAGDETT